MQRNFESRISTPNVARENDEIRRLEQELANARERCKHLEGDIQILIKGRNNEVADLNQTIVSPENKIKASEALNESLKHEIACIKSLKLNKPKQQLKPIRSSPDELIYVNDSGNSIVMEHSTNSINNGPDECSDSSRLTAQKHNGQHNPSKITRFQHISTEITPFNYSDESLNDKTAAPCQNQLRIRNKAAKTNQTVSLSKSNKKSNHSQRSGNRNNGVLNAYTTD